MRLSPRRESPGTGMGGHLKSARKAKLLIINKHIKELTLAVNIMLCITFIYLGFYVAFNTVQVILRRVVGRAEETSTYSSLGFCTVNCRPTASNYQLSHMRPSRESNPGLRGGRRECYHSATVAPCFALHITAKYVDLIGLSLVT